MTGVRALKVVASAALMLVVFQLAEASQVLAEGFLTGQENQMTDQLNAHRASHGLRALPPDAALQMVARRQASRMVAAGYIHHNPNLASEASEAVPHWLKVGENVGVGPSVDAVEDAFLNSPPHHHNIDTGDYNLIGLGALPSGDGALYFTQNYARAKSVATASPARPAAARRARRPARARRARRGRTRVKGIELLRTDLANAPRTKGNVTLIGTLGGMLEHAGGKLAFWT